MPSPRSGVAVSPSSSRGRRCSRSRRYVARLGVVELVDDDDVEGIRRDVRHAVDGQRLHAGEDVPPALRPRAADVQLAEVRVGEHFAIGAERLLEDLPAVRDEQQRRAFVGRPLAQPPVVQRGDHRLAGAGRGDDQVAMPVVHRRARRRALQHLLLVGVRAAPRARTGEIVTRRGRCARTPRRGRRRAGRGRGRGRRLEARRRSSRCRMSPRNFSSRAGRRDARQPDVPLHAVEQRRAREVRRTDVAGVETGVAAEHPRLGVQPGALGVVLDPHLGAELTNEPVERQALGGAHVGGGDDAKGAAAPLQAAELGLQQPQAVPFHEGAEQIHLVRGVDLGPELSARFGSPCVGQQRGVRERRCRAHLEVGDRPWLRGLRQPEQLSRGVAHLGRNILQQVKHVVDEPEASLGGPRRLKLRWRA